MILPVRRAGRACGQPRRGLRKSSNPADKPQPPTSYAKNEISQYQRRFAPAEYWLPITND